MKSNLHTIALGCALALSACAAEDSAPPTSPVPVQTTAGPDLPADHPGVTERAVRSRGPRRMSVSQLERSLDALGNLEPGSIVIPDDLALTLGQPDFLQVYETSLEPSPLFMKFMMDLGAIICSGLADAEAERPADARVFTRHPDLQDNLRYMVLRFLGIDGEAAEGYVERLARVHEAAASASGALPGYQAACIALVTSPDFLLY